MKRRLCHASCLAAMLAAAPIGPAAAQVVQQYDYQPDQIYPVRTGLGITTQIELGSNEDVVDYSTGFSDGWELTRRDNVFYLKPKNVDVDTNLVIRTTTHSYMFELKVVATDWKALEQAKQAGVQYKISFRYPNEAEGLQHRAPSTQLSTVLERGNSYHDDYDYTAHSRQPRLVPVNVYDDGRFTYIRLSDAQAFPSGSFPAVFGRQRDDGEDYVVNTTVEENTIVVHGTYPYLVIRHGSDVVALRRNPPK